MKTKKGFTLIELVVVMAIIAVLALIVIGAVVIARRTSLETAHRANARTVHAAIETTYTRNKYWPCLSCNAGVGHVGVMTPLQLKPENFSGGDCSVTDSNGVLYPTYGVYFYGKLNGQFPTIETRAGLTGQNMNYILGIYNHNCTKIIEYIGIP